MTVSDVTHKKELEQVISHGVSMVEFDAHWCSPCRTQEPIIDAVSKLYKGKATVVRLNIDENQMIAMDLGIQSIPTIIMFKDGLEIDRFIGCQTIAALKKALNKALT